MRARACGSISRNQNSLPACNHDSNAGVISLETGDNFAERRRWKNASREQRIRPLRWSPYCSRYNTLKSIWQMRKDEMKNETTSEFVRIRPNNFTHLDREKATVVKGNGGRNTDIRG